MNDLYEEPLETIDIEQKCLDIFDLDVHIKRVIIGNVQTGVRARTTIFEADRHTLYAFCTADEPIVLRDVQLMIKGMGIEPEFYLPPHGDKDYFVDFGRQAVAEVYPDLKSYAGLEMSFYQTLAPYNPALVRISRIKGEIREYLKPLQQWQKLQNCSYVRIKVQ
jgi:hypothetical protein